MFSPSIGRVQLSAKRAYMVVGRSRASDKGERGRGVQRGHPPFISVVEGPWRAPTQKALHGFKTKTIGCWLGEWERQVFS